MDNHLQRNAQQWFDCVKAYLKSELDINTYCDQNNLSDQRLIYWMGRYYDQKKDLIPAQVIKPIETKKSVCDMKLSSGHEIHLIDKEALTPELANLIYKLSKDNHHATSV